ncbi:MAG: hypothetical protein D6775_11445 [Caldilineae bacterium]|nr:MAG: hypothetical protein D6775_11445 [Caldilineae bacterium]
MKKYLILGSTLVLFLAMFVWVGTARGQANYPLSNCTRGAFSTEEDFMMKESEPYDGNPYISDGDLLSPLGLVCARNRDLLMAFNPAGVAPVDLGLDAVDILNFDVRLVAFSTSLDDVFGKFTAGDLLFTNGGIIPNKALVARFGITHDIGLDAVHFVGDPARIQEFANLAAKTPAETWLQPDVLQRELDSRNIDIWFSVEGTHQTANGYILDGDLLSASGAVIARNGDLLPASVPAGLPTRGVDFGLDGVAAPRVVGDEKLASVYFSTEILFRGEPAFTDGDILRAGNGVVVPNENLIRPFYPAADFLGLDALWAPVGDNTPPRDPNIQTMCGDRPAADFDGGIVPIGGGGTGLYRNNLSVTPPGDPPRRPCGEYVPIDGYLPAGTVKRFRVAYRAAGDPAPAIGTAAGIRTNWQIYQWHGWPFNACLPTGSLSTDANGWMDAATYLGAKDGTLTGCANPGLRLAVWDTNNREGLGPPDKDGHYVLWLEWEDGGGILHREPVEHHLQLDNTLPVINNLELTYQDSSGAIKPVPPCGGATAGTTTFRVNGDFADEFYWSYRVRVRGGNPPAAKYYPWHAYYDGSPESANTDDTGTFPDGTTVFLQEIHMTDLGASFVECCYDLDLWVRDAAIRHSFNHRVANDVSGSSTWWANKFITFSASP